MKHFPTVAALLLGLLALAAYLLWAERRAFAGRVTRPAAQRG